MNITKTVNKVLDSKYTAGTVFMVSGAGKMLSDYYLAPSEKKQEVLKRDAFVLLGTASGVVGYEFLQRGLLKNKHVQKFINNGKSFIMDKLKTKNDRINKTERIFLNNAKTITKSCLSNALMLGFGILGAIGSDCILNKIHKKETEKKKEELMKKEIELEVLYNAQNKIKNGLENNYINKNLENILGKEIKSNMYSRITDLPAMRMFSRTMISAQGFEVLEEETFKKKLHHATQCLVKNALVPVFFLSTTSACTKHLRDWCRLPVIFGSMIFGTMYTNKLIDNISKKQDSTSNQEV